MDPRTLEEGLLLNVWSMCVVTYFSSPPHPSSSPLTLSSPHHLSLSPSPPHPHPLTCRYFCLTDKCLRYAKSKGDSPLCVIPAEDLLTVERVDDTAFGMKFVSHTPLPGFLLWTMPVSVTPCSADVPVSSTRENTVHASQEQRGPHGMVTLSLSPSPFLVLIGCQMELLFPTGSLHWQQRALTPG